MAVSCHVPSAATLGVNGVVDSKNPGAVLGKVIVTVPPGSQPLPAITNFDPTAPELGVSDTDGEHDGGGGVPCVTVNVATVKMVECEQVGENTSWAAPSGALPGTVKESVNAPLLLTAAVPSVVWPQPLTLIDEHPDQSLAEAVTWVPGGPWVGDSVGGVSAALARSADTPIIDSATSRTEMSRDYKKLNSKKYRPTPKESELIS